MPISRFNSKKKEIGQNNHLLSFVVTCCHSLSLVVPLVVTRSTTRCHSLLLVVCIFINDQKSRHFITWMYFDYKRIKRSIFLLCKQTKVQVMMKSVSMLLRIVSDRGRNFPRWLKDSQSYAVFKVGDENNFGSYWPISALSCFSKVLEKIMYERLFNHLSEHSLLYHQQFGFQQGHSTEHAIM